MCQRTVSRLINRRSVIFLFEWPAANCAKTSSSREVSLSGSKAKRSSRHICDTNFLGAQISPEVTVSTARRNCQGGAPGRRNPMHPIRNSDSQSAVVSSSTSTRTGMSLPYCTFLPKTLGSTFAIESKSIISTHGLSFRHSSNKPSASSRVALTSAWVVLFAKQPSSWSQWRFALPPIMRSFLSSDLTRRTPGLLSWREVSQKKDLSARERRNVEDENVTVQRFNSLA